MKSEPTSPIERAVQLSNGVANLATACGVSAQAIYKWLKKGYPPIERCEAVERAVGGKVTKFDLLPPAFAQGLGKSKRRATDPAPLAGHGGRQPASPHNTHPTEGEANEHQ